MKKKKKTVKKKFKAAKKTKEQKNKEIEIYELVKRVKYDNDEKAYHLIREYMSSYIELFSKRTYIAGLGVDDIEQECLVALKYKAIDDFNPKRGSFKTFAVLCIKRHLLSIIKSNKQNKKKVLNISMSLEESRSGDEDDLNLKNLISDDTMNIDEQAEKNEQDAIQKAKLMKKLSEFERAVFVLYIKKYKYDEIVDELKKQGRKNVKAKAVDNCLMRIKAKSKIHFQ